MAITPVEDPDARLWAKTYITGLQVPIYVTDKTDGPVLASTQKVRRGEIYILLRPKFFKQTKTRKFEILVHELTHVLEEHFVEAEFSIETRKECTALAQTMEWLAALLMNARAA